MIARIKLFLIAVFIIGITTLSNAQLLPVNQPEQNACDALQLCGNTFFTPYSYQGEGTVTDLNTTPCLSGEASSVWLKLVVSSPGIIVFTLTPVTPADDYDFAVVNITNGVCSNIQQSEVIRCNFNNNTPIFNNGILGLNTTSTLTSVIGGTTGSPFLQQITAAAGDTYLIMVNNFGVGGGPTSGFTIDFAGSTAVFFDNTPPAFNALSSTSVCNYKNSVTVHLNTPIACNSIAANGSDFNLTPAGTVVSAAGIGCSGTNGYTQDVLVSFAPALNPGNYLLHAQVGTDNNTLLNLCNGAVPITQSLPFTVPATAAYASASLNCQTLTVQTTVPVKCNSIAGNGSDFALTGPGAANIVSAVGVGCTPNGNTSTITLTLANPINVSGTYTLTAQNGTDGNTLQDSCITNQPIGNSITFNAAAKPVLNLVDSLTTCSNTGVTIPLIINNNDPALMYNYQWTPTAGLDDATIAQPVANPGGDQTYTVNVTSNDPSMCSSTASVFVHALQGFALLNNDTAICDGSAVYIVVNGSDEYTYSWTPTTGVSNPNIKNPVLTPSTSTLYTLAASHPGCIDSIVTLQIDVEPNPTDIEIVADRTTMCQYDTIVLHALANPSTFNFSYQWSPAGDLLYTSGPNTAYFGDTSVTVSVIASTPIGCVATDSIRLTVYPGNFASVNLEDTGICPLGAVQLLAGGGATYTWSPTDGLNNSTISNPIASPLTSTDYYVTVTEEHGCKDTLMVKVAVYPAATLLLPDSVNIYAGETYSIQPESNCAYFQWFPPSGLSATNISNPLASPEVRTRYFVNASTERGCPISDSIDVLVKETVIDIPNAFTPGSKGSNDLFKPSKRGIASLKSFSIYNRWGQKVFESNDIDKGWDGTFNDKPQPVGVYIYTIDAVANNGKKFTRNGNVTLIR